MYIGGISIQYIADGITPCVRCCRLCCKCACSSLYYIITCFIFLYMVTVSAHMTSCFIYMMQIQACPEMLGYALSSNNLSIPKHCTGSHVSPKPCHALP